MIVIFCESTPHFFLWRIFGEIFYTELVQIALLYKDPNKLRIEGRHVRLCFLWLDTKLIPVHIFFSLMLFSCLNVALRRFQQVTCCIVNHTILYHALRCWLRNTKTICLLRHSHHCLAPTHGDTFAFFIGLPLLALFAKFSQTRRGNWVGPTITVRLPRDDGGVCAL